ncbi:MAG: cytochrome c [Burkholderiales bacterium]
MSTASTSSAGPRRVHVLLAAATAAGQLAFAAHAASDVVPPNAERRGELLRMVRQDCGSCHGMTLKGGLGPALTPAALQSRPADGLAATILHGRPGTAMPPWQDFISASEAAWIVEQLQRGLPDGH